MRLENNLGGDNIYTDFRVYIEGIEVPFSSANISNTYRGLPTAQVVLAPWRGFSEITKGYFPKIQIFYRDFNQPLAPYDIKRMISSNAMTGTSQAVVEEATETYNKINRQAYKVIFDGVITSVQDSKSLSGDGGQSSFVMSCVHPYYLLNEILFKFIGTSPQTETARDSAFGIMVDGGNVGSVFAIEQALAGIHEPRDSDKTLENGGSDTSVLSDTMSDNYWRLQGMPGVVVAMWNSLKRSAYSADTQQDKSIMTKMYIPLMEIGLKYFTRMTGHPVIEGSIQKDSQVPASSVPVATQTAENGGEVPVGTPGNKTMSARGKTELVEFSEGRRYKLYDDSNSKELAHAADSIGTPTIGIGHAIKKTDTSYDGRVLSDLEVDKLLSQDLRTAENAVNALGLTLSQGQFDALTDLTFNVGPGSRGGKDGALWQASGQPSTIVRLITEGNTQGAANGFSAWVYAGGQVSQGLVNRRSRDQAFFLDAPLPSAQALAANAAAARGTSEELASNNGKLIPGNLNGIMSRSLAEQLLHIMSNDLMSGGTGEVSSFGQFIEQFMGIIEYDHVILSSPAALGIAGKREIIDHVYKPKMFAYYSPICNVLLPHLYESMSVNLGTDQTPSRVIYNGMPFQADASMNMGTDVFAHNFIAPHSVRKALANGGNLSTTLLPLRATPGKYEWGSGVRTADGTLPFWYAVLAQQSESGQSGDQANVFSPEALKAAWAKLYPEDPNLNPWDVDLAGIKAYERLFFTGVDVEYSNIYSQARSGVIDGVFNPFIVPGYPMDVIDPSPLRESYHGFCTSVNHSIDASGYSSTNIGMSSAYTLSEIATCYIPGSYPWLLSQLHMEGNLSMYGNTPAWQRACQYYNDVLGVGAADPTILESYSTGKPIPVKRNMGIWEIGGSEEVTETKHPTLYTTTLGNLNLIARNISTLLDVEEDHCGIGETFVDIDMWNQGSPTVQTIRKGPWVNDGKASESSSTLRGRDMESSAFLDYDVEPETPDLILVPGPRNPDKTPTTGAPVTSEENKATQSAPSTPTVLPKLGKRCSVGVLDGGSQTILSGCHPDLIKVVMKVIETRPVVITSGYRSSAKQASLENDSGSYAQGAKEGSRHRKYPSWAVDMVPCNDLHASSRAVMSNFAQYVIQVGNSLGVKLRWGGNFSTYDPVHFDLGLG